MEWTGGCIRDVTDIVRPRATSYNWEISPSPWRRAPHPLIIDWFNWLNSLNQFIHRSPYTDNSCILLRQLLRGQEHGARINTTVKYFFV